MLFIVDRDHPELLAPLRQEFAAQGAAGLAAIFSDRRQGPGQPTFEPYTFDDHRRRDRLRNPDVSRDLQGLGCAVVPRSEATPAAA